MAQQRSVEKKGVSPVGTAIAGMAVGAAAAVLSDKKKRGKIRAELARAFDKAEKTFEDFKGRAKELTEKISKEWKSEPAGKPKNKLSGKKEN